MDSDTFYDEAKVAIFPMGMCFPGAGKSGDLAPRPICAETWRHRVLTLLPHVSVTLVMGQYAQNWHLPGDAHLSLTERVKNWDGGNIIPLPHPSPRNGFWLRANPWFTQDMLPRLKQKIADALK